MSIEEKPQLLEFTCTVDSMKEVVWNIRYDPKDHVGLYITGNGQSFNCPVELFGDVTDFLQSKNIIKPNVLTRSMTSPTTDFMSKDVARSLTPPIIDGKVAPVISANTDIPTPVGYGVPPMDALASFDITTLSSNQPLVSEEVDSIIGKAVSTGPVITPNDSSEIISRPVIRARGNEDDVQSAEKESAALRGLGAAGVKKSVKRK